MCGGSPSVPPVTPPPSREDPKVAESAAKERARLEARKGRKSTILTSGAGVSEDANSKKKKLLGQ